MGKGSGKSGGKQAGKIVLGLGLAAAGFMHGAWLFGTNSCWMGALYGLSLGTTVWSVLNSSQDEETSSSKFDYQMNSIAPNNMIPVIYGTHKLGGLQSWHSTNKDGESLLKDIIIGEGIIDGVYGVTANNLLIKKEPVFKIYNTKYPEATVQVITTDEPTDNDKQLILHANGVTTKISMQDSYYDVEDDGSNDYCCRVDKLINYISGYGYNNSLAEDGWVVCDPVGVTSSPEDIYEVSTTNCYNNPVPLYSRGLPDCWYKFDNGVNPPDNYEKVGGYKNYAWIRAYLKKSDDLPSSGNPNITAIVRGRRIVDTRKNNAGYIFSDNPAMIVRDYLLNKRFGCGKFITMEMLDEDSFKEVADYCDELVSYKDVSGIIRKEKRYTLDIVLNQRKKHIDNLGEMFAAFGGFLIFTNNKIGLRCEKAAPVSYAFNDDNIVMGSVSFVQTPLTDTPNKYSIGYCDHNYNFSEVKVIVEDYADQVERGVIIDKDITLAGCSRQTQAKRLGRLYKALNRLCSVTMQFQTSTFAMHLEPGDVITISYKNLFVNQPARITEILEEKGVWTIKAQQYNESIYNDNYMAEITVGDYCPIDNAFAGNVPNVSNLVSNQSYYKDTFGNIISDISLTYNLPIYTYFRQVHINYSLDGENFTELATTTDNSYTLHNAVVGKTYYFRVVVENAVGRKSSGTTTNILVTGKDTPPERPNNIRAEKVKGGIILYWDASTEKDIYGYNIYLSENDSGIEQATLFNENYSGTSIYIPIQQNIKYGIYIQAKDNGGNLSDFTSLSYTMSAPADVEWFDCVVIDSDLDFRWRGANGLNYEIRRGDTWDYGTKLIETPANAYRFLFPTVGEHTFWIKAFDEYRNYSINALKATVNILGVNNRNIVKVIDPKANNWEGNKFNTFVNEYGHLQLASGANHGEYIVKVKMPKAFKLRNWIDYTGEAIADDSMTWQKATFKWSDPEADVSWLPLADSSGLTFKNYIATRADSIDNLLCLFPLDNTVNSNDNTIIANENVNIDFGQSQFGQGALIMDTSRLSWNVDIKQEFSMLMTIAKTKEYNYNTVFITLKSDTNNLQFGYDNYGGYFYLRDTNDIENRVYLSVSANDYLRLCIIQRADTRTIMLMSTSTGKCETNTINASPIGEIKNIYCYNKR